MIGLAVLSQIKKSDVAKYFLLPQILPRFQTFFQNGFGHLAYFMALVFRAVNILPSNHAYLSSVNIGRFGVHHVITEAAQHLKFSMKHIDQVIIFFALLAGVVILVGQFLIFLVIMFSNPAKAAGFNAPAGFNQFFITAAPQEDLALRLLDEVFGIPNFFGSNYAGTTPFHTGLHGLLQLYSTALLVVGAIILAYMIFAVVAETAQSGTPFGKRYNHVWAPIRLVAAFGLLIPVQYGFNSAQWVTLYAAKFGSAFATNGWIEFNNTLNRTFLEQNEAIATPETPSNFRDLAQFMTVANGCFDAYIDKYQITIDPYLVKAIDGGVSQLLLPTDYQGALDFFNDDDITIRFGAANAAHKANSANIFPYCGELTLQTTDADPNSGAFIINEAYYNLIKDMWDFGRNAAFDQVTLEAVNIVDAVLTHAVVPPPNPTLRENMINAMQAEIDPEIANAVAAQRAQVIVDPTLLTYGWGGAAIWYNKIAQYNGQIVSAALNVPTVRYHAYVLEFAKAKNLIENANTSERGEFDNDVKGGQNTIFDNTVDEGIHKALVQVNNFWIEDKSETTNNIFIDTVNLLFGTKGLFDMCENEQIHPLAQISGLGKSLMETSVRNIGLGALFGAIGLGGVAPSAAISSFFITIASITIMIGFILYYVVPFMPFLYFLFALGGWVKGIFEAMVGVPLWALAHLRIDGNGLAGEAALNGYFLIFEIFVRPIMIVFGLLAAISIFGAMVTVLHDVFFLAVSNLSGFDAENVSVCGQSNGTAQVGSLEYLRGPIDELFFTVVYAILVYMIGMGCFKMIDQIPNQILRWMGIGISTFNDQAGEPAEGLTSRIAVGGSVLGGQLQGAGSALAGSASGLARAANTPAK